MRWYERMFGRVGAVGLVIVVGLLVTGGVLALVGRGPSLPTALEVSDLPRSLAELEPAGFLGLGLLVLLATPVIRVAALMIGFARAKSWVFSLMSALVLALIALSAYLGVRG
jgi:uncharacterized membrane protein